jgi:hypothetical protein
MPPVEWVILRLIHVVSGTFWFSAALIMFLFLQPTAAAVGPGGQGFMLHLLRRRRLADIVFGASILTVTAGSILFWWDSDGLQLDWITQPMGLAFTIGAIAAWVGFLGFAIIGWPAGRRLVAIAGRVQDEGRPPTEEEQRDLARAQRQLRQTGLTVLVLVSVAIAAMATARYWPLVF